MEEVNWIIPVTMGFDPKRLHFRELILGNMKVFLKAGDQIYLNGANICVDRKVSIQLLNKTKFILHDHLLKADEVDSPVKQLYFAIQLMIVNATSPSGARKLYDALMKSILDENKSPEFARIIRQVEDDVRNDREYHALKILKKHF